MRFGKRIGGWLRRLSGIKSELFVSLRDTWDQVAGLGKIGQGMDANVVMAPVQFIQRTFTQSVPVVAERNPAGATRKWAIIDDHPLEQLLADPNPFYDGDTLTKAFLLSWFIDGNAYLLKGRNGLRGVNRLWYLPHWLVQPKWPRAEASHDNFVTHYEYDGLDGMGKRVVALSDIVHLRVGLDPRNPRKGLSPIKAALREVLTDEEAATFSAFILGNMGVPGGVIAPKTSDFPPNADDLEEMREHMTTGFTGKKRGKWLVLGQPTEVSQFGFDPNRLMLGPLRDISEERICAMIGVPAAVVGFGAGLQSTKVGAPQPLSARLWTPSGPTTMGEVEVGRVVAIPDGWGQVEAVYPQGVQDIYRVTFQDGSTAESTIDHLWDVKLPGDKERRVMPLSEVAALSWYKLRRTTVPLQGVTEFAEQPTLIPPYMMGLLLADGSFRHNLFFSNANPEIVEAIREEVPAGYDVNRSTQDGHDYRISYRDAARGRGIGGGTGDLNPFKDELRRLGLWMLYSHEKFIPDVYKYNSSRVRRELLRGILDGDGYVNLHGQPALEQTSPQLSSDVTQVVQSLGGYTLESHKKADRRERLISGRPMRSRHDRLHLTIVVEDAASLFRCSEKRDRCRRRKKAATRKFRSVELVRREAAQCISVDGGLYLTDNFIVTHNTMRELVKLAKVNCIEPTQVTIGRQIGRQLLPDFEPKPKDFRVVYDNSEVSMFLEEEDALAKRAGELYTDGLATRNEGRAMVRLEPVEGGDAFSSSTSSTVRTDEGGDDGEGEVDEDPPSANRLEGSEWGAWGHDPNGDDPL